MMAHSHCNFSSRGSKRQARGARTCTQEKRSYTCIFSFFPSSLPSLRDGFVDSQLMSDSCVRGREIISWNPRPNKLRSSSSFVPGKLTGNLPQNKPGPARGLEPLVNQAKGVPHKKKHHPQGSRLEVIETSRLGVHRKAGSRRRKWRTQEATFCTGVGGAVLENGCQRGSCGYPISNLRLGTFICH